MAAQGPLSTYTRRSDQTRYDAQAINSAIDEALICHVGYVDDGEPFVIPTVHTRLGADIYVRTTAEGRLAGLAATAGGSGIPLCVTVSLLDGLVLARSEADNEINYRTVVARGRGVLVTDEAEKRDVLDAVVEHLVAGRSRHSRSPTEAELAEIALIRVPLDDVAIKARSGPPLDEEGDLGLHHWAGVIGIRNAYGPPIPAPDLPYDRQVPAQLANYSRSARPQGYR